MRRANVDLKAFTALRKQFPEIRAAVNTARVNGLLLYAARMRKRAEGLERDAAKIKRYGDQLEV